MIRRTETMAAEMESKRQSSWQSIGKDIASPNSCLPALSASSPLSTPPSPSPSSARNPSSEASPKSEPVLSAKQNVPKNEFKTLMASNQNHTQSNQREGNHPPVVSQTKEDGDDDLEGDGSEPIRGHDRRNQATESEKLWEEMSSKKPIRLLKYKSQYNCPQDVMTISDEVIHLVKQRNGTPSGGLLSYPCPYPSMSSPSSDGRRFSQQIYQIAFDSDPIPGAAEIDVKKKRSTTRNSRNDGQKEVEEGEEGEDVPGIRGAIDAGVDGIAIGEINEEDHVDLLPHLVSHLMSVHHKKEGSQRLMRMAKDGEGGRGEGGAQGERHKNREGARDVHLFVNQLSLAEEILAAEAGHEPRGPFRGNRLKETETEMESESETELEMAEGNCVQNLSQVNNLGGKHVKDIIIVLESEEEDDSDLVDTLIEEDMDINERQERRRVTIGQPLNDRRSGKHFPRFYLLNSSPDALYEYPSIRDCLCCSIM